MVPAIFPSRHAGGPHKDFPKVRFNMKNLTGKRFVIGIGAQKAGTTWLGRYFSTHPDIFMSPIKELHFFDLRAVPSFRPIQEEAFLQSLRKMASNVKHPRQIAERDPYYRGLVNYVERFEMKTTDDYLAFFNRRVGDERVFCEISPDYSVLRTRDFRQMHSLHPDTKLIFIMRDPAERYWSNLRFYQKIIKGFDAGEKFEDGFSDMNFVAKSNYKHTLEALDEAVPEEDVLVLFYEDLFTRATIERICGFLDVPVRYPDFDKRVNESADITLSEDRKAMAVRRFAYVYDYVVKRYGTRVPKRWRDNMATYLDQGVPN